MEVALTRTSTSVGPIDGTGTACISRPLPVWVLRSAFIVADIRAGSSSGQDGYFIPSARLNANTRYPANTWAGGLPPETQPKRITHPVVPCSALACLHLSHRSTPLLLLSTEAKRNL